MYDIAKSARAASKSKARRLAEEKDEKVSSSDWTAPEPLNADVKTGARPLKRRVYKSGGKVDGSCGPMRADRKPRKSGGRALTANSLINRDVREANEEREGIKHVGAFKKGGRVGKMTGGLSKDGKPVVSPTAHRADPVPLPPRRPEPAAEQRAMTPAEEAAAQAEMDRMIQRSRDAQTTRKSGGRAKKAEGGDIDVASLVGLRPITKTKPAISQLAENMKKGGRAKKMMGGPMMDARMGMVEPTRMKFSGAQGTPYKKGGKAEHADEAMDKALIKKMVKPEARKGKTIGGALTKSGLGGILPMALEGLRGDKDEKAHGGRTARKSGGRAKGKTNINIVIAAGRGKKDEDQGDMPMPGGRMPIPAPRAAAAPMPGMMPPMAAAGMGAPPAPPPGMPAPMPRKDGGRITKVASSYKDMEAGAGSGEGRLQKTDIAAKQPKPGLKRGVIVDDNKGYPNKVNGATGGRTARKEGGKVYRSYKDMDAGAGSGKGRLEKTEIESHKRVR